MAVNVLTYDARKLKHKIMNCLNINRYLYFAWTVCLNVSVHITAKC